MKSTFTSFLLLSLTLLMSVPFEGIAQDNVITFQGRVQSGGENFSGMGQFKYALVTVIDTTAPATATATISGQFVTIISVTSSGNGYVTAPSVSIVGGGGSGATATASVSNGVVTGIEVTYPGSGYTSVPTVLVAPPPEDPAYTTYWSNDGTSVDGSEPAGIVNVSVTDGLFTARLGDTTVENMAALPAGLFQQPDLHLRVWFNDGINGFAALKPTQALTAAPYALAADSASSLAGTLPASQLTGTLPGTALSGAYSEVVTFNNAANSFTGNGAGLSELNASQLANGTVPDARLAASVARTSQVWLLGGNAGTTPGIHFLGTADNQPLELKVNNERGLRLEYPTSGGVPNLIGGYSSNRIGSGTYGAVISGGGKAGDASAIGVNSSSSAIGGGNNNIIADDSSSTTIAGGQDNDIGVNADYSAIGGGLDNNIASSTAYAIIAGGRLNDIGPSSGDSAIGGGYNNNIADNAIRATIAGGSLNDIGVSANYSAIGGGNNNNIADNSKFATLAGGYFNDIGTNSDYSAIAGGSLNDIGTNSGNSAIGGGYDNNIADNAPFATIAGGFDNDIGTNSDYSTIGGGYDNGIAADSGTATIAGGIGNRIRTAADSSAIGGGGNNAIGTNSNYSTIGGGNNNNIADNARYATIPGGRYNLAAGTHSFAAGQRAKANHPGTFVWADSTDAAFASSGDNQFLIRASGGVGIGTTNPVTRLTVAGAGNYNTIGAAAVTLENTAASRKWQWHVLDSGNIQLADHTASSTRMIVNGSGNVGIGIINPIHKLHVAGNIVATGTVTGSSDRNVKEHFAPVDPGQVLEKVASLPIQRWNYIGEETPHLGPVAQDFHGAFQVGMDDKHISMVDADGVALAAIQGLNGKVEARMKKAEGRMRKLEVENAALKARLEILERLINEANGGQR